MTVGKGGACGLPVRIAARSGAGIRSSCVHLEAPTGPGPVARLSLYICEGPQVRFALSRDGVASAKPLLQLTPSDANRSESERAQTVKRTAAMLWGIVVLAATAAGAENEAKKAAPHPLPLHTIEGTSGIFLTDTAYFANTPAGDGWFGLPSAAVSGVRLGHKFLQAYTVTANVFKRVELGYSYMHLGLGDWPSDVRRATGLHPETSTRLHTLSARAMVVKEGSFGSPWTPAITAGLRYKHNASVSDIDDDLNGTCQAIGVRDDDGWEPTLTASKMFKGILPKPFILSAGLRRTKATHIGLCGFSDDYHTVLEGSAVFFVTDRLLLGAEYREKPDELNRIPGLVGKEDDWWDIVFCYIVNDHLTVSGGYAHLGKVLNHDENASWALQLKWEF